MDVGDRWHHSSRAKRGQQLDQLGDEDLVVDEQEIEQDRNGMSLQLLDFGRRLGHLRYRFFYREELVLQFCQTLRCFLEPSHRGRGQR